MRVFLSGTILLGAFVLTFALTPGIASAKHGICNPPHGSILARTGGTYIYKTRTAPDERIFACSRKFRGRTVVSYDSMDSFEDLTVRGSFLAFKHTAFLYSDGIDPTYIEVVNLRLHRDSDRAKVKVTTPTALQLCADNGGGETCSFDPRGPLHLTRRGSVAFVADVGEVNEDCVDECVDPPDTHAIYRFQFSSDFKRHDIRVLDWVRNKEVSSLRLAGPRVRWTSHGKKKSAAIR